MKKEKLADDTIYDVTGFTWLVALSRQLYVA